MPTYREQETVAGLVYESGGVGLHLWLSVSCDGVSDKDRGGWICGLDLFLQCCTERERVTKTDQQKTRHL